MDFIAQLWQPILLATFLCFVVSALVWMFAPHHKKEWKGPPNQDGVMDLLRKGNVAAGGYLFPFGDRSDKAAFAEAMKKFAEGPAGVMYVFPKGPMNMRKMLGQQFAFFLLVNLMLALLGSRVGLDGQPYLHVFKVIGFVAFMTYAVGVAPESIWFGRPWKSYLLGAVDGLLYACVTAGAFGWLWPR
jgi:hypothetical protein